MQNNANDIMSRNPEEATAIFKKRDPYVAYDEVPTRRRRSPAGTTIKVRDERRKKGKAAKAARKTNRRKK